MTAPAVTATSIKRTYYLLQFGNTLAASLIWGINTIFLLDAGLSNLEAFTANAFFTAGMVLFEVPTGIVADMWGRRISFLLGTITLAVTTALYLLLWQVHGPFWQWALVSLLLGLGFTFFSGAVEAWLVDALATTDNRATLESVFARGQVLGGLGMFIGAIGGGYLAQLTNLGVPFLARAGVLVVMFGVAFFLMRDIGFVPKRDGRPLAEMGAIVSKSVEYGWRVPAVRNLMLAGVFTGGVGIYIFYALQPYLLELWGDPNAYGIAGLAAAVVAGSQILGGTIAPWVRGWFRRRTTALLLAEILSVFVVVLVGLVTNFWVAVVLIVLWAMFSAMALPIRQAYLNGLIPSHQRATILSFDSLVSSSGGVVAQPILGRAADVWGYPASYLIGGVISAFAVPFLLLSRRQRNPADLGDEQQSPDASGAAGAQGAAGTPAEPAGPAEGRPADASAEGSAGTPAQG